MVESQSRGTSWKSGVRYRFLLKQGPDQISEEVVDRETAVDGTKAACDAEWRSRSESCENRRTRNGRGRKRWGAKVARDPAKFSSRNEGLIAAAISLRTLRRRPCTPHARKHGQTCTHTWANKHTLEQTRTNGATGVSTTTEREEHVETYTYTRHEVTQARCRVHVNRDLDSKCRYGGKTSPARLQRSFASFRCFIAMTPARVSPASPEVGWPLAWKIGRNFGIIR